MRVTQEGLDLIKAFEGFRAKAYRDAVGIWTIGYGHTSMAGPPDVTPGLVISRADAEHILARDVEAFAKGVRESVHVPLTDQQFSALVSFAYNVGLGAFRSSSVLKALNARDFAAVPRRLNLWVKAGGRTLPGLVRRRAAEGALFMTEGVGPAKPQPERPAEAVAPKPMGKSKTAWSAIAAALLALAQGVYLANASLFYVAVALGIAALAAIIIFERIKKMKQEGV